MAGQNKINFEVGFQVNNNNLKELQSQLTKVTTIMNNAKASGKLTKELEEAGTMAKQLSSILETSFNRDLGTVNISKFNQGLKQAGITSEQVRTSLIGQGNAGVAAYAKLTTSILNTNIQLKEQNKLLNSMATTMVNTVKWGAASSILNTMTGAIRDAYSYSKQLDSSLTSIRIVTGDSADQMARFAEQANTAAKNLGSTTLDYTKSALSFYQQGLDDEAVANRTEATLKASNVTGARAEEMANDLTAVWNGFQAQIGTEVDYVDKLAAVADSSASNLAELATAMSKVASVANNMGVDMDQLTAQISTIIATTRQAPETVGNALKTIYARINDIKTGSDEAEISLGNYTGKMASLGINVLDATGHLRDTGEVMEEIGSKWGSMGREQQIYLAQTMAGQRQMNNLVALFDNWTQYSDMLNVSLEAQGTLDEKNNRYLESTQAHLNELKSTYQDLYSTLINNDELNTGIDTIRNLVEVLDNFLEGFGGGIKSITAFGSIIAFVFKDQIGQAIGQFQVNSQIAQQNLEQWATKAAAIQAEMGTMNMATATPKDQGAYAEAQINQKNAQRLLEVQKGLTTEKQKQLIDEQTYIGEQTKEMAMQEAIKNNALQNETLKNLELQAEQNYTSALEEELSTKYSSLNLEEGIQAALQSRVKEIQTFLDTETAVNAAGEELAWTEELKTQLLNEQKQLMIDIEAISKAQVADEAEIARSEAEINVQRAQGKFDRETDYAATIAYAKANTDLWLGSITTLTMAWGSLSSIVKTFTDENASGMEKFSQILMTLGFTIPMIVSSISKVKGAIETLYGGMVAKSIASTQALLGEAGAQAMLNAAVQEGAITEAVATKVKEGKIAALTAEEIAQLKELGVVEAGIGVYIKDTLNRGVNTSSIWLQIAAKTGLIAVTEGEIVTVGALLAAYLPVIAVIGAVIAVGYGLAKAYDAQNAKAREAAQAAADAKQEAEDLSRGYEDLKSALDGLKNQEKTLAGLTKGTREWNEAVMQLNEQVLALLDTYPQLAQYLENKDGVLSISEEGIQSILDEQLQRAQNAQSYALQKRADAAREENLYEAQQLGRQVGTSGISPEQIVDAAKALSEHSAEIATAGDNAAEVLDKYTGIGEENAAKLLENTSALLELNATAKGIENLEQNRAKVNLQDNEDYTNSKYQDEIDEVYNRRYDEAYNEAKNKYGGQTTSANGNYSYDTYNKNDLVDIWEDLNNIKLTEDEIKKLSKQELVEKIAGYEAAQKLAEEETEIIKAGEENGRRHAQSMSDAERAAAALEDKFKDLGNVNTEAYKNEQTAIEKAVNGQTIEGDDVSAIEALLTANGQEMSDYFTLMADGTYKLKDDAKDFEEVANELSLEPFKQQIRDAQEQIDALNGVKNIGKEGIDDYQWSKEGQQAQIDYLAAAGYTDTGFLGELQTRLDSGKFLSPDQVAALAQECGNWAKQYDVVMDKQEQLIQQQQQVQQQLANGAKSIKELNEQLAEGIITRDQYNEALTAHGANEDVNAEKVRELTKVLSEEAETLDWVDDSMQGNTEMATALAGAIEDTIEGVETIQDQWDEWTKTGLDTTEVMGEMTDVLEDMFNTDISQDFVKDHLGDIERLANGDMTAIADLQVAIGDIGFDSFSEGLSESAAQGLAEAKSLFDQAGANGYFDTLQAGVEIDDAPFYTALQAMILESGKSEEEINKLLAQIGYEPVIEWVDLTPADVKTTDNGNTYTYTVESTIPGDPPREVTLDEQYANEMRTTGHTRIPIVKGSRFKGNPIAAGNSGRTTPKSTGGGGGKGKKGGGKKGSSKKPNKPKKKEQAKDPYHDVNIELDHTEDKLKKLQREEKKLTGEQYLKNLQKQNKELEKQRELYREKGLIAEREARRQQAELAKSGFSFGENGDITNYFDNLANLKAQVDAAYAKANSDSRTEKDVKTYEALAQAYDDVVKKIKEYEDTLGIMQEMDEKFAEARDQQIENQIKTFNYSIEVILDTKEFRKELNELEKDIKRIQDTDFRNLFNFNFNQAQVNVKEAAELMKDLKTIRQEYDKMNGAKDNKAIQQRQQAIVNQQNKVVTAQEKVESTRTKKAEAQQKLKDAQEAAKNKNTKANRKAVQNAEKLLADAKTNFENAKNELANQENELDRLNKEHTKFMKQFESQIYGDNAAAALEDLKKYREELMQRAQDLVKILDDMVKNNIEAFNYNINLRLDTSDFMQDFRKFRKDVLQKLKKDEFSKLSLYSKEQAANDRKDVNATVKHIQQIMADINAMNNDKYNAHYFDNIDQAYEDLEEFADVLMKKGEDIAEIFDDCQQNWLDTIDAAKEAFDEQTNQFERIDDILGHQQKMFTMLHGDENYNQLAIMAQKQADNSKANLTFLKREQDYWYKAMQSAEKGSEAWKKYKENWEDAVDATNKAVEQTAEYFYDKYTNTIKKIGKVLQDSFAGGDWEKRQSVWEDYKRDDQRYLDTLTRATKTYNLIERTQNAIGSANVKNQKELNKWLNKTQENLTNQTRLRQIDLDLAEKELDILLKQQALEDAKTNKSKMRLRRDSQGNYRYQFVADQNAIDKAQEDLRNSIEELRLLAKNDMKTTTDEMYNLISEINEQVADAADKYGTGTSAFNDAVDFIMKRYQSQIKDIGDDYAEMASKYGEYLGAEATELSSQLGEQFQSIAGLGADAFKQLQDIYSPKGQAVSLLESFTSTIHYDAIKEMPTKIADSFNAVTDLLPSATSDFTEQVGNIAKGLVEKFVADAKTAQREYAGDISDVAKESGQQFDNMSKAIDKTVASTKKFIEENEKLISTQNQNIRNAKDLADWAKKELEWYNTKAKPILDNVTEALTDSDRYKTEFDQNKFYNEALQDMVDIKTSLDTISGILEGLASYDTGGYTGDGDGGKLAVLHPREYVLTEQDTPNILTAAKIARDVMQQVQSFKDGMMPMTENAMFSKLAGVISEVSNNEQNIVINADFSGVESAIEIKKAFNEIVNLASQRASGNRRTY